jgi:hypothetical protein
MLASSPALASSPEKLDELFELPHAATIVAKAIAVVANKRSFFMIPSYVGSARSPPRPGPLLPKKSRTVETRSPPSFASLRSPALRTRGRSDAPRAYFPTPSNAKRDSRPGASSLEKCRFLDERTQGHEGCWMLSSMTSQTAAQKAPRANEPARDQKNRESESKTRDDERETLIDDDLYANLAHTD